MVLNIGVVFMSMFLTRNEVMDILRISSSTLQRYMKQYDTNEDGLQYFKFKGRVLFQKDKLEEFVSDNSVVSPTK